MHRAAAVVLILFSAGALAHPGHADGPLWHLLTEPDHLALILLPAVIAGALLFRRRTRKHGARTSESRPRW